MTRGELRLGRVGGSLALLHVLALDPEHHPVVSASCDVVFFPTKLQLSSNKLFVYVQYVQYSMCSMCSTCTRMCACTGLGVAFKQSIRSSKCSTLLMYKSAL